MRISLYNGDSYAGPCFRAHGYTLVYALIP
jgi:hypothetical protein